MPDVQYDFATAEALSRALNVLAVKLNDLASTRASRNSAYLTTGNPGTAWEGPKHDDFLRTFNNQQATLAGFHDRALMIKQQLDQATLQASDDVDRQTPTTTGGHF